MMNEHFDTLREKVEALIKGRRPWRPKGHHMWSNDDMEDNMSLPQSEEQHKRCELPLSDERRKHNTCFERDTSHGGITVQQEGYKTLQKVIRDQVASEPSSIETTVSLDDEVEHWE